MSMRVRSDGENENEPNDLPKINERKTDKLCVGSHCVWCKVCELSKDSRKSKPLELLISFCVFLRRPLVGKITTGGEKNCSRRGKKRFPFCFHL